MATIREHLKAFHDGAAAHHKFESELHTAKAAHHEQLAKCFSKMAKAAGGDDGKMYQDIADAHDSAAKAHAKFAKISADYSAFHAGCANDCEKSEQDRLGKTIMPDRISGVIPSDAPAPFGIRAVPRTGQPTPGGTIDKTSVAPQFRHLLSNLDEEV